MKLEDRDEGLLPDVPPTPAEIPPGVDRRTFMMRSQPLLYGVGLAVLLTFLLKETGTAARPPAPAAARVNP